jgi:hypothetical protein
MPGKGARFPLSDGFFNVYSVADPATNADIIWTPPANLIVQPLCVAWILFAANLGSARAVTIHVEWPAGFGNRIFADIYPVAQPINTTQFYNAKSSGKTLNVNFSFDTLDMLDTCRLTAADRIVVGFTNKQAADRLSQFRVSVLEWRNTP